MEQNQLSIPAFKVEPSGLITFGFPEVNYLRSVNYAPVYRAYILLGAYDMHCETGSAYVDFKKNETKAKLKLNFCILGHPVFYLKQPEILDNNSVASEDICSMHEIASFIMKVQDPYTLNRVYELAYTYILPDSLKKVYPKLKEDILKGDYDSSYAIKKEMDSKRVISLLPITEITSLKKEMVKLFQNFP